MSQMKISPDWLLFEDEDFLALNKPPFISTLEDRTSPENILSMLRTRVADAQVGHRLDKDTSGVLIVAKNPEAYRHISMQFEHREIKKVYHAVSDGLHSFADVEVDASILKQNDGTARISRHGKEAQTRFTTLQAYKHHTLIECHPVTGRMHQIRVHLASLKAPITGDELYGGKPFYLSTVKRGFKLEKDTEEQPLMKRMALHAYSVEFLSRKGQKTVVQAPYPKDFQALVKQLANNTR